jgi:hypothetical protein
MDWNNAITTAEQQYNEVQAVGREKGQERRPERREGVTE